MMNTGSLKKTGSESQSYYIDKFYIELSKISVSYLL